MLGLAVTWQQIQKAALDVPGGSSRHVRGTFHELVRGVILGQRFVTYPSGYNLFKDLA